MVEVAVCRGRCLACKGRGHGHGLVRSVRSQQRQVGVKVGERTCAAIPSVEGLEKARPWALNKRHSVNGPRLLFATAIEC